MLLFKVNYETTIYENTDIKKDLVTCYFNDINEVMNKFGLSKEEIVELYYKINPQSTVNSVVKSIEKYTEEDENDKPKICVHFA